MNRWTRQQQIGVLLIVLLLFWTFARPLLSHPLSIVLYLVAIVVAITVHEFGHAWFANVLGDPTARLQGRVSLNPIVHFDPVGAMMILFTMLSGLGIGWGKPVPVNPRKLSGGRRGMALVSVAGVIMNLLTAGVLALSLYLLTGSLASSGSGQLFVALLQTVIRVNVLLAVFNFIVALPPLDGYNFLINVLPLRAAFRLRSLERYGPILLLLLILASQMGLLGINILGLVVSWPSAVILGWLHVA